MSQILKGLFDTMSRFILGLFAKPAQEIPLPPVSPSNLPPVQPGPPIPPGPPAQPIPPPPVPIHPPPPHVALHWWHGSYPITQGYGCTDFALEGHNPHHPECAYFHEGIDFALPCGTPIYARDRVLIAAVDPPGYGPPGNSAAIQMHDGAHDIWLYHMNSYVVRVGEWVSPGALIGYSGTRGYSTGCHIHFEVRLNNAPYRSSVNPSAWL